MKIYVFTYYTMNTGIDTHVFKTLNDTVACVYRHLKHSWFDEDRSEITTWLEGFKDTDESDFQNDYIVGNRSEVRIESFVISHVPNG